MIIIGFIAGSFEDFGNLEKGCWKIDWNGFRLDRVKNQREN